MCRWSTSSSSSWAFVVCVWFVRLLLVWLDRSSAQCHLAIRPVSKDSQALILKHVRRRWRWLLLLPLHQTLLLSFDACSLALASQDLLFTSLARLTFQRVQLPQPLLLLCQHRRLRTTPRVGVATRRVVHPGIRQMRCPRSAFPCPSCCVSLILVEIHSWMLHCPRPLTTASWHNGESVWYYGKYVCVYVYVLVQVHVRIWVDVSFYVCLANHFGCPWRFSSQKKTMFFVTCLETDLKVLHVWNGCMLCGQQHPRIKCCSLEDTRLLV